MTDEPKLWPEGEDSGNGPLKGVRVLDLTTVLMGPSATQILGDLGADVVKIEGLGGDTMRLIGPWRHEGMGALFLQANRNKRSVVIDLKTAQGKEAISRLAKQADVLVSNVRPQGLARLGLDYGSVSAANHRIIYCVAVGYGSNGPQSGKPVYDDLMQAALGIAGLFRKVDGAPRYAPINICDRVVGLYLANAITSALYYRAMTGQGQAIEVPMFETMAQFVLADHMGGRPLFPRSAIWGINAFCRGRGGLMRRKTATSLSWSTPTGDGAISRSWLVAPISWIPPALPLAGKPNAVR